MLQWQTSLFMIASTTEQFALAATLKRKPNTNQVSGVLIGSANTQRTSMPSDWILELVHLTSCFGFNFVWSGKQDSVHS